MLRSIVNAAVKICPKIETFLADVLRKLAFHVARSAGAGTIWDVQKVKLYLDTSVISHIDAPHKPEAEAMTYAFYRFVEERSGEYELVISPVVEQEVENCPEPKRTKLKTFLLELDCAVLPATPQAEDLVEVYVAKGVLTAKHHNDLSHIAYAVVSGCHFVISWNFEHFVNDRTPVRVNIVNAKRGYCAVTILSPPDLMRAIHDTEPKI